MTVMSTERYRKAKADLEEAVYEFYVAGADDHAAHEVVERLVQDYLDDHETSANDRFKR